jgi:hypothetical protein
MASVQQLQTLLSGRQYTNPNKSIYEEKPAAPPPVLSSQIRSATVPLAAPFGTPEKALPGAVYPSTGVPILAMVQNSPMTAANSITNLSFNHPSLPIAIQDSYGNGTYRAYITNNAGTRVIPLGSNGMFINYSGGNITFSKPMPDVTNTKPPRIWLYVYAGASVTPASQHTVSLQKVAPVAASSLLCGTVEITVQSTITGSPAATIVLSRTDATQLPRYNILMATLAADDSCLVFTWAPNTCIMVNKTSLLYDGAYTIVTSFGA